MFIGLDFSPLRGGFIKPPALRVVGDSLFHLLFGLFTLACGGAAIVPLKVTVAARFDGIGPK